MGLAIPMAERAALATLTKERSLPDYPSSDLHKNSVNNTSTSLPLSVADAKNYIYNQIDFSKIIAKMVDHLGWQAWEADKMCQMYKNFLFLIFLHRYQGNTDMLSPSEDIDEFWHLHILDTQQYAKDCDRLFGKRLEHYPYLGIDGKTN
ncbi:MAG: hypothetical protein K0R12_853, partial [Gammaproteobacteria bacterium]|nr:hypothetical protein [Gammaproteobacteria bacterium]